MITLRELKEKDAEFMLEWMHDRDIQNCFIKDMLSATIEDALEFCRKSKIPSCISDGTSLHYAIVNETDEYLGTISLKNIDKYNGTAEYAITLRKKAVGKGIAFEATGIILQKAFLDIHLNRVFLSVLPDNNAAIRLYERCGFVCEGEFRNHIRKGDKYMNWKWYGMLKEEYDKYIKGGQRQVTELICNSILLGVA